MLNFEEYEYPAMAKKEVALPKHGNKADRYMAQDIIDILANGYLDENPRPKYTDGTPAHTLSVNHHLRKYDISKGEFPICSLRPIAWKTGVKEIFAIYQNQSNKVSEFERLGCGWWKDWMLEDGTIGRSYPYNMESHRPNEMKRTVVRVQRKIVDDKYRELEETPTFEMQPSMDGKVYFDRYIVLGRDFEKEAVMNKEGSKHHSYYKIQFINNGHITTLRGDDVGRYKGNMLNPYERTAFGVGYLGNYKLVKNFEDWEVSILMTKWHNMLKRCYSLKYKAESPTYKNVFVHNRWHSFENFLRDVRYLPQYFLAKEEKFENWHLDKDYYGSNAYSKDTCVFLKLKENITYARSDGYYEITDENGNKFYDLTIAGFAERIGVSRQKIHRALKENQNYKGFKIKKMNDNTEYVYRYELSRNQLVHLLKDLVDNPYGRRHIISFWHWANIDKKALVECAYETIWNVRNDGNGNEYLDMTLIQRSGDMLMASGAGGINEISYVALLMMVARHCGYKVGVFTHFVANEQIYDRFYEASDEMLSRYKTLETDRIPVLSLNADKTDFFNFTIEDFTMLNYSPIRPQIILPIAI